MDKTWEEVKISPFRQDVMGWEGEVNGKHVIYPPTFDWHAWVQARRSDGVNFHVKIILLNSEVDAHKMAKMDLLWARLQNAILTFETYRNCDCTVAKQCRKHSGVQR
jgi:hypothetical protein